MYSLQELPTIESILAVVTEKDIFEYYSKVEVRFDKSYRSFFRNDPHSGCKYVVTNSGHLCFVDYSRGVSYGCFSFVQNLLGLTLRGAIDRIHADLIVNHDKNILLTPRTEYKKHEKAAIKVESRPFSRLDAFYWSRFGLNFDDLKFFDVVACESVWINEELSYVHNSKDPAYAYIFGSEDVKVYFPRRSKNSELSRFLGNCSGIVEGIKKLPFEGDLLIITKSYKDVMTLRKVGAFAVSPSSETTDIPDDTIAEFKQRFRKIISLYDFDLAGIKGSKKLFKRYGIDRYFLTDGRFGSINFQVKDPAEYVSKYGLDAAIQLFNQFIYQYG